MALTKRKLIYPIFVILVFFGLLAISILFIQLRDLDALRDMVVQEIREETQREVQIGSAQLDFSEGVGLLLNDVTLKGPAGKDSDVSSKKVLVLLHLLPLMNGEIQIEKLIFEALRLQVVRNEKGSFNFGDLSAGKPRADSLQISDLIRAGLMHSVQVRKGELWLIDHYVSAGTQPVVTKVTDLTISLTRQFFMESLRIHVDGQVPLSPEKNGTIKINGKLRLPGDLSNLSKIALEGTVTVSDLGTQPMELYLSQVFAQKLESGAVSLDAEFEGTLDGHIRSSGKLTYRFGPGLMPPGLYKEIQQSRGSLSYDLAFQNDTLKVHKLLFHSGAFSMNARGTYARFLSDRAQLDVFMKTSPFSIENSESHLPFKIFSKELHHRFREIIPRGELEIASLEFKGPVSRFREISKPEILEDFSGVLLLRRVNVTPPEFSLHQVEGEVHFQKGSAALKISKARYGHLVLTNVLGAVSHPLTRPEVKATLEAQGALAPLVTLLEQREAPRPRKGLLEQIKHIKGIGRGRITVEGILESPDSLKWSGDITIERAGFLKEKWPAPFRNVNGQLHFEVEGDTDASSPGLGRDWRIEFDQFSGEILKHSFSRLKGEWLQNKNLRTADIQANLRLAELKAESILPQKVAEPVQAAMKDITLAGAEINLSLQSQEPVLPGKDSTFKGSLDIHNLFVRHAKGYPPLNNVQGTLAFDPKKIVLKTKSGWYGTSPFTLVARLRNYRQDDFNLILSMESAEFAHADFAEIPFLETLKYRGPAHLKIKFLCNRDTIKLKQHIDLKRASYQFGDFLIKPENVANFINISASRDDEGRLSFNHLEVGLADNRVTGQGYLRSLDDPEFALKMASDRFQVWPASQYIRPLKGALGGRARFQLSAKGHFRHLEDAVIKGKVALNRIEYHPDPFRVPIVVSAGLKFLNHRFTIHKGKLSAKNASLFFEGDYRGGTSPHMKFRLTGPGINLNEIVAAGGKPSQGFLGWLSGTRVFSLGSGEVHIDVGRFTRDFWTFPRFTGDFTFKDQTLKTRNLEIGRPKVDQIMVQGQLKLEEGRKPAFDAVLVSRNIPSKNFFKVFGGLFQNGLTGHLAWLKIRLKGQGDNLKEIKKSLRGRLSLDFRKGRINNGWLLNGVTRLFEIPTAEATMAERNRRKDSAYLQIFGDFEVTHGLARTRNFMFEDKSQRLSLVGGFDLNTYRMDTVVGVAPFRKVDRVLEKIPLVGKILTGGDEGSLIINYYSVKGPFSGPAVQSVPLTSISKKLLGTFQGVLQTPRELFTHKESDSP